MDYQLIGLLGAIAEYWQVPYLSAAVVQDIEESGTADVLAAELFIVGTNRAGIILHHLRIRTHWFNYMLLDWRKGMSIKRLVARFPVLRDSVRQAGMIDTDFPDTPAMQEVASALVHSSGIGVYQSCVLHESGKEE